MDHERFDRIARALAGVASRRAAIGTLFGGTAAGLLAAPSAASNTEARKKKKGKGKKRCAKTGQPCGGTAGKTCCGNTTCLNGRCACGPAQKSCQNRCINKDACCTNKDCGGKGACTKSGACTCPKNKKACRGGCIGKGQCCTDKDCGGAATCQDTHICICPADKDQCGSTCTDMKTDVDNCGECGRKCSGGSICSNGILCQAATCLPIAKIEREAKLAPNGDVTLHAEPLDGGGELSGKIEFAVPPGTKFKDITSMTTTFDFSIGRCVSGSPRFYFKPKDSTLPYVFAYMHYEQCTTPGSKGSSINLIGNNTPGEWDDRGDSANNTYDAVYTKFANAEIDRIVFVLDSSSGVATVTVNPCVVITTP